MGCACSCGKDGYEPEVPLSELGKPSQPGKPECKKIDNTNIEITWSAPADDGGDQVTGYVIQQHNEGSSEDWVTKEEHWISTTYTFTDMDPGIYEFRIVATNSVGEGESSDPSETLTILAPLEIRLRGPEALAAYQKALKEGKEEIHCVRLMLVGQERVGKTSLVKAFMGQRFSQREEITDGVDASNACSVPFSEPSNWKPLKRNTEEHIKQLDEQHNYGVGIVAASKLDPELDYEKTEALREEGGNVDVDNSNLREEEEQQKYEIQGIPHEQDLSELDQDEEKEDEVPETKALREGEGNAVADNSNLREEEQQEDEIQGTPNEQDSGELDQDEEKEDEVPEQVAPEDRKTVEKEQQKSDEKQEPKAPEKEDTLQEDHSPKQGSITEPNCSTSESECQAQPSEESKQDGNIASGTDKSETLSNTHRQEQVIEIPEDVMKAKKSAEDLEITFWDFAGQDLYYTTHQVFFNRRTIFALVFDMSKKLEEQCLVQDFSVAVSEEKSRRFDDFTGEDFLRFWLQSIYTYAVQDSADSKYPPIFIIGTHKRDQHVVGEDVVKKQIFRIIEKKPYATYVRRRFHFLENNPDKKQPSDDEALSSLKEAIATSAMEAPHMKEKYPIKWLNFHKAVLQKVDSGTHYMKYEETKELAASLYISDESQFTTMLNLYHDLGAIIWFGDQGQSLKNTVILDPQWLIDVFKAVITVKPDEEQDADFSPFWQELQEHGILRKQLIDHVWRSWLDIKEDLLEIMEKFDIMVKNILQNEDEKESDGERDDYKQLLEYCVPACLQPVDKSEDENIMDGTFYVDFGNFLPDGFFHRVLVYFSRWSSAHTGEPFKLFYRKCESFVGQAENLHECSLLMVPSSARSDSASIKVVVKRVGYEDGNESTQTDPDPEVCTRVYEFIEKTLQVLRNKWARCITYKMDVCCVACRKAGKKELHLIPVEECKGPQPFFCPRMKKKIAVKKLYWNAETDSSSGDTPSQPKPADQKKQGPHIMISYAWGDRAKEFPCQKRMIQLRDELEKADFLVWLDVQEMRGNMDDRMAEAVDGASVILLCYSKEYQESRSCKKEAQYASYKNKPIIPLKFDNHKPDGWLGLLVCNLLYYDVKSEEAMKKNLPAIINDIGNTESLSTGGLTKLVKDQTKQETRKPAGTAAKTNTTGATSKKVTAADIGEWEKTGVVGEDRLRWPRGIALINADTMAVADSNGVYLYSTGGEYKYECDTTTQKLEYPSGVVYISERLYVTDGTAYVKCYNDKNGEFIDKWLSVDKYEQASHDTSLYGICLHGSCIMVGACYRKYVSKHELDGRHLGSFKVDIELKCMAATSDGNVIISDYYKVQIVNETGHVLHRLQHADISDSFMYGVFCCSGVVYVCGADQAKVYCFNEYTGEYITCIILDERQPDDEYGGSRCVMLDENSQTLWVTRGYIGTAGVEVYTRKN